MWQRFTQQGRMALTYAQEEAGRVGESYVSTEHMLLGVLRDSDSVAARVLTGMGVRIASIRFEIEALVAPGQPIDAEELQLTARVKHAIDLASEEARNLGNDCIGTGHILTGLMREDGGVAGRVLVKQGVSLDQARAAVTELQHSEPPEEVSPSPISLDGPMKLLRDVMSIFKPH